LKLRVRYAENSFDAVGIANRDLSVGLFEEAGARVNRFSFDENALDRVDRRLAAIAPDLVKHLNHKVVQGPQQQIQWIPRYRKFARGRHMEKSLIDFCYLCDSGCGRQIETKAERDDCANHEWSPYSRTEPAAQLAREIEAPLRIRFPEVDTGSQPIVIIVTRGERCALKQPFADSLIAAVVAEDEARRKLMQREKLCAKFFLEGT
jgi:hypothetical protein